MEVIEVSPQIPPGPPFAKGGIAAVVEGVSPSLVYSPHPLLAGAGRRVEYSAFLPGESIALYLERVGIQLGSKPVVLCLNGEVITRDEWALTVPKNGDLITLRARVRDGGGGGSDPMRTILSIAVMVAAFYIAGPEGLALAGWQAAATQAAIIVGGNMLINALLPPPKPKLSELGGRLDNPSPTYSLSGGSNRARPYEPMPVVMGNHVIFADYGAKFCTEFEGEDQYLHQVFHFGLSDLVLSNFRIGTTALTSFQGYEIQESGADGKLTLFPANVDTLAGGALTQSGGWVQRTSSIDATALAVDIAGNLYYTGDSGITAHSVTFEIEYRLVGSPTWLPLVGAASAVTISNADRKPLRLTYRKTLAQGQYEVRVRRTTADETDARAVSDIAWQQLRTYQPDPADYTGQKRVALRIKASGQLNGQVEQFNAVASAKAITWSGSAWTSALETSNPAWWFLAFARGKNIGAKRAYGGGLPDSRIDIESIKAFGAWCTAKSLTFDAVIDSSMSCAEILHLIARCGRGFPTWATGKLGVIWDAENQPHVAVFGMSNIKRNTFSVEYITEKLSDEIVVTFINPDLDWQQDRVRVTVPGVTQPVSEATVDLFGCKNKAMAGKECNLLAAKQFYQRRRVTWEADFEGMVCQRGDVAVLSHDLTQWGYSGRIVDGTSTVLNLDRKVPFTVAQSHYVGIRFPNGYYQIFDVVYQAGEADAITLTAALPVLDDLGNTLYAPGADPNHPACDYLWFFEPKATPGKKVKITGVQPLDEHYVRLTATDETPDYYASENGTFHYVTPGTYGGLPPALSNLIVTEELILVGTGYAVRLTLTWGVTGQYDHAVIRAGLNGAPLKEEGTSPTLRFEFTVPDTGQLALEIDGIHPLGWTGPNSKLTTTYTILGKAAVPPDVAMLLVNTLIDGTRQFLWGMASTPPDLAGWKIRYSTDTGATWPAMQALHTGLLLASPYETNQLARGTYKFGIVAEDTSGNASANPIYLLATLSDSPNQGSLYAIDEHSAGWPGTATGFIKHWTGVLVPDDQHPASYYGWEVFDQFVPTPVASAHYDTLTHDLAFDDSLKVYSTIQAIPGPGVTGTPNVAFSLDSWLTGATDPAIWTPWTVQILQLRYLRGRVTHVPGAVPAYIKTFTLNVDKTSSAKKDGGTLTVAPGGTHITFTSQFHFPPLVTPSVITGSSALFATVANVTNTGCDLHIWNTSGTDVGGSANWAAEGV